VNVLLDTQVVLWWLTDDERLDRPAREVVADAEVATVSVASAWEMSLKVQLGKLELPDDLGAQLARHGFSVLPIHLGHALQYRALPLLHRDPFDRMLVAQAQVEQLAIVTADPAIARYAVDVIAAHGGV
jgi:PIN domain nuclease of toxin-antitoxin system